MTRTYLFTLVAGIWGAMLKNEVMFFFGGGLLGLFGVAFWLFCCFDVLTTTEQQCRNLPKLAWVLIVILFLDLGAVGWVFFGRPRGDGLNGRNSPKQSASWGPKQHSGQNPRATNPDDDEEFLAKLKAQELERRRNEMPPDE